MSKYSREFKLKVIHHYLAGNAGFIQVTLLHGLNRYVLPKWAHADQLHGKDLSSDRGPYTQIFKLPVLRYKEQRQFSANGAAMHFNIPSAAKVSSWQRLYNERGATVFKCDVLGQSSSMSKSIDLQQILKIPLTELTPQELLRRAQF